MDIRKAVASRKQSPPTPAKISAPRLIKPYPRTRLFRSLDALRQPILWISGPAGAGKTTLVVSYLNARNIEFLWYQLDVRDDDPAAFFYYLREAIRKASPRRTENLPLLTPEYLAGLATFTRNFFERLFSRMRQPAALVLDNFQDLPEHCITQQVLSSALCEIPDGIQVIFLSRSGPPPALARLKIQRSLASLEAQSLKLTLAEARGIARLQNGPRIDNKQLEQLHGQVQGWMAGWILLLMHAREGAATKETLPRKARDTLFQFFATELFEHSAPAVQNLLLKSSLLPQVAAASAAALTGIGTAAMILEDLEHCNYFTTRLSGDEPIYQFHPLFQAFLRERLARTSSVEELRALQVRAAAVLCERGQYEDAAALMISSGDMTGLAQLALSQAPILAQQGRFGTLDTWLRSLPGSFAESRAWIAYWLGTCRMLTDIKEARAHLERAYQLFKTEDDSLGRYTAWAAIIESYYYEWDDFTQIDTWFDEIDSLQRQCPLSRWPDVEIRVVYAALMVLGFARATVAGIAPWVERAWALWNSNLDLKARGPIIACLGLYYFWRGDASKLRPFFTDLRQYATSDAMDPFVRLQFHWILCSQWITGENLAESMDWVQKALAFSESIGVRSFDGFYLSCGAAICQIQDDIKGAARYVEGLHRTLTPGQRLNLCLYLYYQSWLEQRRGEHASACALLEQALEVAIQTGARHAIVVIQVSLADCLTPLGESRRALAQIESAERWAAEADNALLQFICHLARAWDAMRNGSDSDSRTLLGEALRYGREHQFTFYPWWIAPKMSEICGYALRHRIEHEYAAKLVRARGLVPDVNDAFLHEWPYPIKIHALGHFFVLRDDEPLTFAGKSPKKPLELLKGIIAAGGRNVSEKQLARSLWPQAEDPVQALSITLHRLRKLIGDEAIERQDQLLSLNPRCVFVDVWALEHVLELTSAACQDHDAAAAAALAKRATALYGTGFLSEDTDARWAAPLREKLRKKVVRQLEVVADVMRRAGRLTESAAVTEQAVDIGVLAPSSA